MSPNTTLSRTRRTMWIAAGMLSASVGTIGIFVPGLPTTVFLLVASWCFSRGSERLHRRLHAHPRLGRYLELARGRSMPLRARIASLGAMWAGIGLAFLVGSQQPAVLRLVLLVAGGAGTTAILLAGRFRWSLSAA